MKAIKWMAIASGSILYGVTVGLVVGVCDKAGLDLPLPAWVAVVATATAMTFWNWNP